jgi:hypothetical protein
MWRVVCVGPTPEDRVRRVTDRGPLHTEKARAESFATFLRATGLYESVRVEAGSVATAAARMAGGPASQATDRSTGET